MSRAVAMPIALLGACLPVAAAADEATDVRSLAHNPFDRPPLVALGAAAGTLAASGARSAPPELRAVMLDGRRSLANLGGHIVALGEESEGWRLAAVREDGVELEGHGQRVSLPLRGGEEAQDE